MRCFIHVIYRPLVITINTFFRKIPVSTDRDTNNNFEESQKTSVTSPNSTNWSWWKNTSQHVTDWITSNESHAAKDGQNSQKRKHGPAWTCLNGPACRLHGQPQKRKRTLSRKGSSRYRASFRPKKGKTQ